MHPRLTFGSVAGVTGTAILVVLTLARSAHGQDGGLVPDRQASRSRIQVSDVRLRRSAESAVRLASDRAVAQGCQGLLSEFVDQDGQPLAARLESLQMSLQDYVHTVIFVDGRAHAACEGPVAVTMPGSRVVYLCARLTKEPRAESWVAIIHEVLHSLGLPENPPTPAFISSRPFALPVTVLADAQAGVAAQSPRVPDTHPDRSTVGRRRPSWRLGHRARFRDATDRCPCRRRQATGGSS